MALSISEANAVSHEYFDSTLSQEAYDDSAFLAWAKSKNNIVNIDGDTIQWPVRYKKLDKTDSVAARDQILFQSAETRTAGTLALKYIVGKTVMHWDETVRNGTKSKIIDLMKDKVTELKEDFNDEFATQLWDTTSTLPTNNIQSLPFIVDSANTYAGIAVADDSNWASTEDSTSTILTMSLLQKNRNAATLGKKRPTVHFTTRNLLSKFESILQPYMRYTSADNQKMLDLGFENVSFYGSPVVADAYCPTGYWLGIDMDSVEIAASADYNMKPSDWEPLFQAGYPNALAKVMTFVGNVVFRIRKTSFKLSALDYSL
jgi:hypothetical protein